MKELPILFSTPMVEALLAGRKTHTRRLVKGIALDWLGPEVLFTPEYVACRDNSLSPYGYDGDLLWVRETWKSVGFDSDQHKMNIMYKDGSTMWVKMPAEVKLHAQNTWKPSIHMHKAAARIWLKNAHVCIQRLQDISEEDILSEGVRILTNNGRLVLELGSKNSAMDFLPNGCLAVGAEPLSEMQLLFAHWASLWSKINGRESWDANPWVWVIEFEVVSTTGYPKLKI